MTVTDRPRGRGRVAAELGWAGRAAASLIRRGGAFYRGVYKVLSCGGGKRSSYTIPWRHMLSSIYYPRIPSPYAILAYYPAAERSDPTGGGAAEEAAGVRRESLLDQLDDRLPVTLLERDQVS